LLAQGPPGTGKTSTVAAIVAALRLKGLLQRPHRILLCAPSNAAVDELLLRLRRDGLLPTTAGGTTNDLLREGSMLRLGNLEHIHGAPYGDDKIANRDTKVWHGATENGSLNDGQIQKPSARL
jgi:superfamily I DNA and/or RNA helicase